MFKHILVPIDGSKLSEMAVREAVLLAKEAHAKVTALHVIPEFHALTYHADMLETTREEYATSAVEHAKDYLAFAERVAKAAEVDCDTVTMTGDHPFRDIIETANNKDCDLILMASHGRHGIEGFLLGSETQKVLTHSKVPVLVYR